ncbi:glycoside hydrolase family 43 protein [Nesterenkonia haasae]|uniref:glycoside hydrolase family 43 protein n=1 Tax=Nesterenkonia haasae TaxID=2587813 RepID=UPI001390BB45|nr:glycoside hydrolase family 43 protein [Nesterenkonia haasae]NDK30997.1 1,4-beta-xylanase [Nesterenkonia haasae]
MSIEQTSGYLLVHFVESSTTHMEKIYFSRSQGNDPTRWERLNAGHAVLESHLGTGGVRDPHIVRRRDGSGFTLMATDLRVWEHGHHTPESWRHWTSNGSRSLVLWDSEDLVTWSAPRLKEVAPPSAGMAWAPKAMYDTVHQEYLVFWSSHLYGDDDPTHTQPSYSRILASRTADFHTFSTPQTVLDTGSSVIDMCAIEADGKVHRFFKEDSFREDSPGLCHEVGDHFFADDFLRLAENIGNDRYRQVEGPVVFPDRLVSGRWHLMVDQYMDEPQGYVGLYTDRIASGNWSWSPGFSAPESTKHGSVLALSRSEWERLDHAFGRSESSSR